MPIPSPGFFREVLRRLPPAGPIRNGVHQRLPQLPWFVHTGPPENPGEGGATAKVYRVS